MKLPANNPLIVGLMLVLILGSIYLIQSMKPDTGVTQGEVETIAEEMNGMHPAAPELAGITGYLNVEPGFKLASVKGNVILVDFWTYSCINCIRTLPFLNAWHEKYKGKGLVIVGVHTPEFEFEKETENVKRAMEKHGVEYRVVQDNDYATWRAYNNNFWPRKYLIDADGFIRYNQIGEGGYEETEEMIRKLLLERDPTLDLGGLASQSMEEEVDSSKIHDVTHETYLGYEFGLSRKNLGNPEGFQPNQTITYSLPSEIEPSFAYLDGAWTNNPENIELASESGKVVLNYYAKALNIVADGSLARVTVLLDGEPLTFEHKGDDVVLADGESFVLVREERLYNLIRSPDYSTHTITLEVEGDFKLYTFTFG